MVVVVVVLLLLFISLVRYFYIFGFRHVDESKFGTPTWEGFQSLHTKISAVSAVVFRRVLLLTLTHIHIQRGPSIIVFLPFRRWSHPFSRHSLTFDVTPLKKWGPGSPQSQDLLVQGVMISNVSFWDHGSVWSLSHTPKK